MRLAGCAPTATPSIFGLMWCVRPPFDPREHEYIPCILVTVPTVDNSYVPHSR